jgi:plasmid stabilization system protein ParE
MVQMAEADQDHDSASAIRRSLEELADEDRLCQQGAAEVPEDLRRLVATAPPKIWPIGVSPDQAGVMPVNRSIGTF